MRTLESAMSFLWVNKTTRNKPRFVGQRFLVNKSMTDDSSTRKVTAKVPEGGWRVFRFCYQISLSITSKIMVVVQSFSPVRLFAAPWTAARQASLSFTISQSLLKLMSVESVMLSNHLSLCRPLLLLPFMFPSIRVFSNESALHISWPKYWSFSLSISPSNLL